MGASKRDLQAVFHLNLSLVGNIKGACEKTGITPHTAYNWFKKDPTFEQACRRLLSAGHTRRTARRIAVDAGQVPPFLEWRTLHCAYLDQRAGKVHRAVNSWFQVDAHAQLEQHNRLLMVLPPGHMKTTFFSIEKPTHAIMTNRNTRITVIEKNEEEAAKVVAAVQQRLWDHEYYGSMIQALTDQGEEPILDPIREYGGKEGYKPRSHRAGETWGTHGFRVIQTTSGEKDYTMAAKGAGSQIQGIRSDMIILDDIQDPRLISPGNSKQLLDWFQRVILGRIFDWQKLIVLGNLFEPTDFMNLLIETYPDWPVIRYPAVRSNGEPLVPEVWTKEGLEKKRKEVGETVWYYTWMQAEGSFEDAVFKKDKLDAAKNHSRRLGQVPDWVTHISLGCDPAIAESGYCAIQVWGLDARTGRRAIIDLMNERNMRTWGRVQNEIARFCETYDIDIAIVEKANQQAAIVNDDAFKKTIKGMGTSLELYAPRTATGAQAEGDDFDISVLGDLFDAELMDIPYADVHSRKVIDDYCQQLMNWRPKPPGAKSWRLVRDQVMASLFAEAPLSEIYRKYRREKRAPAKSRAPGWATNGQGQYPWVHRRRRTARIVDGKIQLTDS